MRLFLCIFCVIAFVAGALGQPALPQDLEALARDGYRARRYVEAEVAAKAWAEEQRSKSAKGEWSDLASALALLRNIQLARGDGAGATATLDELAQRLEKEEQHRELVETLFRAGRADAAERAAKRWVEAERKAGDGGYPKEALRLLRTVQLGRGDRVGAEDTFKNIIRLLEKQREYAEIAQTYYQAKRYAQAEAAARKWLDNVPKEERESLDGDMGRALELLSEIQIARRNFKGAESSLKRLLRLLENNKASGLQIAEVLDQLVLVFQELGKQVEAREPAQRSWDLRSKTAELADGCTVSAKAAGNVEADCASAGGGRKKKARKGKRKTPGADEDFLASDQSPLAVVPVFFGTDRKKRDASESPNQGRAGERVDFDGSRNHQITLGKAMVTVPRQHGEGQLERPWVLTIAGVTVYEEAEDPNKHFVVKSVDIYDKDRFLGEVGAHLSRSQAYKDQAFVFVHGYNVAFDSALFRTAQIAFDLKFDGAAFLYSWPSAGEASAYQGDRSAATQAYAYVEEFIRLVIEQTGAKKVHLVAHSMGNVPVLNALENIAKAGGFRGGKTVGELILAAPDVDRDEFANRLRTLESIRAGGTLYASRKDKAMEVSRVWNGGVPRAGDVPPDGPVISKGIFTIDASYLGTQVFAINHSGYAESHELLLDIAQLFKFGKQPPKFRWPLLRVMDTPKGSYWRYTPGEKAP